MMTAHDVSPKLIPQMELNAGRSSLPLLFRDIVDRRDLCTTLARKDFFVRYRRAMFGVLWSVALPLVQATVLAIVLQRVAKISIPHYTAFILSGTVAWTYFSTSLGGGSTSIVDNSSLSSRIYFPRAILPLAVCLSNLFTLGISTIIAVVFAWMSGGTFSWRIILLLPASSLLFVLTLSFVLVLSAAHVYLRDTVYAVQAALLVWFYATPVFYPVSRLHGLARTVIICNPMTGIVELFQSATLGVAARDDWLISLGWMVGLFTLAAYLHSRFDRTFADLL